mgnify:CR=1 FL=1
MKPETLLSSAECKTCGGKIRRKKNGIPLCICERKKTESTGRKRTEDHRNTSQNLAKKRVSVQKNKSSTGKKEQKHFSDLLKDAEKGYCWSQKPVSIPSGYGRKCVNVLGFLDAVTHQVLKVMEKEENYLNADSVCRGLKMIQKHNPEEKQIDIILDNASYQHCKKSNGNCCSLWNCACFSSTVFSKFEFD